MAPPRSYDPFATGPNEVAERELEASDPARGRSFPIAVWEPAGGGARALVLYSHSSGGNRRSATFLGRHLASHGYRVAALDHSEIVAPELRRHDGEGPAERERRVEAVIAGRVPDLRLLLDRLAGAEPVGLAGHSFGGWSVLAAAQDDGRVGSVVAMAPGGASNPKPGILPLTLEMRRPVPALFLAAEQDVFVPARGVEELWRRAPGPARMWVLRRADHAHFVDDVEGDHEALRTGDFPPEMSWIGEMLPYRELSSAEAAHTFVRGLTLAHFDATLRSLEAAAGFWAGDVAGELVARGVDAFYR